MTQRITYRTTNKKRRLRWDRIFIALLLVAGIAAAAVWLPGQLHAKSQMEQDPASTADNAAQDTDSPLAADGDAAQDAGSLPAGDGGALPAASLSLQPLTGFTGAGTFAAGINGAYEVVTCPDSTCRVAYIDYAANREVWLCSQPNCTHNSESCTAWFPYESASVFIQNDTLFLFSTLVDDENRYVTVLYQMDLDGSQRREVCRLASGASIRNMIVGDGENFYFSVYEMSDGSTHNWLCCLHPDTGTLDKLVELGKSEWVLSAFDDCLSVCSLTGESTFTYYTYRPATGERQTFFTRKAGESVGYPVGRYLYYLVPKADQLADFYRVDAVSGETALLCDCAPLFDMERTLVESLTEDRFTYTATDVDLATYSAAVHTYDIDLATGTLQECLLYRNGAAEKGTIPVLAAVGGEYLVETGTKEAFEVFVDMPEGGYTRVVEQPVYAFISREDYYAGNPNYRFVDTSLMQ